MQFSAPVTPLAAVPRFSTLSEEEFIQVTVDVLMSSLGLELPLIPYGYAVTNFQNPDYKIYIRRFNIVYDNTNVEYDQQQTIASTVVQDVIGQHRFEQGGWQLSSLKPELSTSGSSIIVMYGMTLHITSINLKSFLISDDELSKLLNATVMNNNFENLQSNLRVLSIKELSGSDPVQNINNSKPVVSSPSDTIPVFLIVGVGAISAILVSVYVVGTVRVCCCRCCRCCFFK